MSQSKRKSGAQKQDASEEDARVAELESILRDLDDEDQLQCQAPSWLENGDYNPCEVCSCCKAKAVVRKR